MSAARPIPELLQNGQLLKASVDSIPLVTHYGIVVADGTELYVLHNTPFKGSVMEPLTEWLRGRSLIEVKDTKLQGMPAPLILEHFNQTCKRQYHLFNYNCEHFIDCMLDRSMKSEQVGRWLFFSLLGFLTLKVL